MWVDLRQTLWLILFILGGVVAKRLVVLLCHESVVCYTPAFGV